MASARQKQSGLKMTENSQIYLHQFNLEVDNKRFFKKISKLEN